ncbi:hypothetical protein [Chitinophaga sp. 22620]|uniref:hypothetical protein n=1 Tax=Chitinophaga sp. 22620 TaxID=3453952 RepID=UPI003F87DEBD
MELFTACCRQGKLLLKADEHKQIVLQSLGFLTREQRIWLYGFVILDDEFHLLWKKQPAWETKNIRQMMLKFIAQQIKHRLRCIRSPELEKYKSSRNDRLYHFWEKNPGTTTIVSPEMAGETMGLLHEVPVSNGLCATPEEYLYSSARCYAISQQERKRGAGVSPITRTTGESSWLYHISEAAGILLHPADSSHCKPPGGETNGRLIVTDFRTAFDTACICCRENAG